MQRVIRLLIKSSCLCLLFNWQVRACPPADGLIDYNCDGIQKITITGDSFVNGVGDTEGQGGYLGRLESIFAGSRVKNLGVSGITTSRLLRLFKDNFITRESNIVKSRARDADIFIIDVGRNDYFNFQDANITVRNIKRLVKFIRSKFRSWNIAEPSFVVATLLPTKRSYQQPFVREVNRLLLEEKSRGFPVNLRFDQLSADKNVSQDGLHPNARGYKTMASNIRKYITGRLQTIERRKRPDTDQDGLYDMFEQPKYGTNPLLSDTDGDGTNDGEEVSRGSNPLIAGPE